MSSCSRVSIIEINSLLEIINLIFYQRQHINVVTGERNVNQNDKLFDMCVIGKFICIQQSCSFIVILYLYSAWHWCMVRALIHFTTGRRDATRASLLGRRGVTPRWHADWLHPLHLLNNTLYCFIIVCTDLTASLSEKIYIFNGVRFFLYKKCF